MHTFGPPLLSKVYKEVLSDRLDTENEIIIRKLPSGLKMDLNHNVRHSHIQNLGLYRDKPKYNDLDGRFVYIEPDKAWIDELEKEDKEIQKQKQELAKELEKLAKETQKLA